MSRNILVMNTQTSKPITHSRSNEDPAPNAGKGTFRGDALGIFCLGHSSICILMFSRHESLADYTSIFQGCLVYINSTDKRELLVLYTY